MDKQKDFEKGWEEYKAKKKQEIEEIYRLIDNSCALVNNCIECQFGKQDKFDCDKLCVATAIINEGYRKIPENAVVLTSEEWQKMKNSLYYSKEALEKKLQKARKETAEKFVERLKLRLFEYMDNDVSYDEFCKGNVVCGEIDEICKEITEGEKEISNETV